MHRGDGSFLAAHREGRGEGVMHGGAGAAEEALVEPKVVVQHLPSASGTGPGEASSSCG